MACFYLSARLRRSCGRLGLVFDHREFAAGISNCELAVDAIGNCEFVPAFNLQSIWLNLPEELHGVVAARHHDQDNGAVRGALHWALVV